MAEAVSDVLDDLRDVARARAQYERADGHIRRDRADLAEKARARGWEILRQVLERHPWAPRRVKKRRGSR